MNNQQALDLMVNNIDTIIGIILMGLGIGIFILVRSYEKRKKRDALVSGEEQ
jgi:F0F1-type ATP synthase assembly protein I